MLKIKSTEIFADLRSAAWLESELHSELDRHRWHEMADICEVDNAECVWRVLGIAAAEVRVSLQKLLCQQQTLSSENNIERPESWDFNFKFPLQKSTLAFIKEKIHEFFVAAVMADRCAVIIPTACATWQTRKTDALAALQQIAAATYPPFSRIRRYIWPL